MPNYVARRFLESGKRDYCSFSSEFNHQTNRQLVEGIDVILHYSNMRTYKAVTASLLCLGLIIFFVETRLTQTAYWREFCGKTSYEGIVESDYKKLWDSLFVKRTLWIQSLITNGTQINTTKDERTEQYLAERNAIEDEMEITESKRKSTLTQLGLMIQRKMWELQNPEQCNSSKILICEVPLACGLGCYTHFITNCLIQAFESERVLVLHSGNFRYSDGWEGAFLPLSKCKMDLSAKLAPRIRAENHNKRVVGVMANRVPPWLPWSIPAEISSTLQPIHGDPFAWWLGQFVSYAMRPQPWLVDRLRKKIPALGFSSPIVGIQVRRGDKLASEAHFRDIDQYMFFVEQWYRRQSMKNRNLEKVVFVATEDVDILRDLKNRYPDYRFIADMENSLNKLGKNKYEIRFTSDGLDSIFVDMYLLSRCDYVVCTLSSNVCRVVYNLMMIAQADASTKFQSVDMIFQYKRTTNAPWRTVSTHIPYNKNELAVKPGDHIAVIMNTLFPYLKGYVNGTNLRTGETGLLPATKARPFVFIHPYTILENINQPH